MKEYFLKSFLPNFWPNLASTIMAIVIGIPIALWLTRYQQAVQERVQQTEQMDRLRNALTTVAGSIEFNRGQLDQLAKNLAGDRAPFEAGLDLSAWDASKTEIIPFLRDAELQRRIGHHFERLASVARLTNLYLDQVAGVQSALQSSAQTGIALRNHLQEVTSELVKASADLQALIRQAQK